MLSVDTDGFRLKGLWDSRRFWRSSFIIWAGKILHQWMSGFRFAEDEVVLQGSYPHESTSRETV